MIFLTIMEKTRLVIIHQFLLIVLKLQELVQPIFFKSRKIWISIFFSKTLLILTTI